MFDNFGNILIENASFEALVSVNEYVWNIDKHNCNRTFHYTDVFAVTEANKSIALEAIRCYKLGYIENK